MNFPIPPGPPELTCTPYDGTTPSVLPHAGFADCLRALYVLPDVGNVPRTGCLTDSDLVVLAESLSSTATCRIATWSRIGKAHCIQYDVVKAAAEKIILGCKSREVATGRTIVGGTISLGGGRNGDVEGVVVYAG